MTRIIKLGSWKFAKADVGVRVRFRPDLIYSPAGECGIIARISAPWVFVQLDNFPERLLSMAKTEDLQAIEEEEIKHMPHPIVVFGNCDSLIYAATRIMCTVASATEALQRVEQRLPFEIIIISERAMREMGPMAMAFMHHAYIESRFFLAITNAEFNRADIFRDGTTWHFPMTEGRLDQLVGFIENKKG